MNEFSLQDPNLLSLQQGIPQETPVLPLLFPEMSMGRLEQTPPQGQTKRCSKCFTVHLVSNFTNKTSKYLHSWCRPCRYAYLKVWGKIRRDNVRAARPSPEKCKVCGNETLFHWKNKQWNCGQCSKIRAKKTDRIRQNRYKRRVTIRNYTKKYGSKIVELILSKQKKNPKYVPDFFALRNLLLPSNYMKLRREALERLHSINEMLGLPSGNVGWTCQKCHCYSADPRFFDIDHIIPRSKKGHGKRSNLQLLCPNYHRRKTIVDLHQVILEDELH